MYGFAVHCDDCYDGAPDSSTRGDVGIGLTREAAVASWNEFVESWEDTTGTPSAIK